MDVPARPEQQLKAPAERGQSARPVPGARAEQFDGSTCLGPARFRLGRIGPPARTGSGAASAARPAVIRCGQYHSEPVRVRSDSARRLGGLLCLIAWPCCVLLLRDAVT